MSPRPGRPSRPRSRRPDRPPPRPATPSPFTLDAPAGIPPAEARWFTRLAIAVAVLLFAGLLAMVMGPHRIGDYFTETDFYGGYADGARMIEVGRIDPSRYGVVGPGFEVALALAGLVVRNLFVAAELISVFCTTATLLLLFSLLARRAGPRVGFFAVLLFAVNPWVFRFGYIASTDAFSIALQVLALWLLLAGPGRRLRIGAGLAAAAAFLTRYNAIYLLPAGIMILLRERAAARREGAAGAPATPAPPRFGGSLEYAAAFLLPVLVWVAWSATHGGATSLQLYHNIAYEVYARHQGMVWDDYQKKLQPQFHSLWDVVRRDPPLFFLRMILNFFDHLRLDAMQLLGWPAAVAVVLGVALALASGSFAVIAPLLISGAWLFLSLVPTFYSERYALALLPVYVSCAGLLFGLPRFAIARRGRPLWLKWALVLVPVVFSVRASIPLERQAISFLPVEVLDAAKALKAVARPGDAVIARKPHLAFHAGVKPVAFPFTNTIPELADYAHQNHVRWLYVSWPEVETRPRYWHLLDPTGVMPGLTPIHTTAPHPSVLYEIGPEFGQLPAWYSNDTLMTLHTSRAQLLVTPNDPQALYTLALVMRSRREPDSARRYLGAALAVKPHFLGALLLDGELALQMNDVPVALQRFQTAVQYHPSSVDARVGLGWATLISGRIEEAGQIWRPVTQACADPPTLRRMMDVYERLGNTAAREEAAARLAEVMRSPQGAP